MRPSCSLVTAVRVSSGPRKKLGFLSEKPLPLAPPPPSPSLSQTHAHARPLAMSCTHNHDAIPSGLAVALALARSRPPGGRDGSPLPARPSRPGGTPAAGGPPHYEVNGVRIRGPKGRTSTGAPRRRAAAAAAAPPPPLPPVRDSFGPSSGGRRSNGHTSSIDVLVRIPLSCSRLIHFIN